MMPGSLKSLPFHKDDDIRYRDIRRMILVRVLLIPFIMILLVCIILIYNFAGTLENEVRSKHIQIVDMHRRLIDQFLKERTDDLLLTAVVFDFQDLIDKDKLTSFFNQLQLRSSAFLDIGVFDKSGNHVCYIGPYQNLLGKNYSDAVWFQNVSENHLSISDVFLGYRNIPHFIIAVKSPRGDEEWYLRATIDTLFFNDLVESIAIGSTGEAYLVNNEGILQTKRRSGSSLMDKDPDYGSYIFHQKEIISFTMHSFDGHSYFYATGGLQSAGWHLIVRQQTADIFSPLIRSTIFAVILLLAGGVIVFAMAFLLSSSLANQLTVADLEKKELGNQLIVAGKLAEIGEMSAGIAHEINNPLQVIQSEQTLLSELLKEIDQGSPVEDQNLAMLKDSVSQIAIQLDRCKNITHGLLNFARKSNPSFQNIDINFFISEVIGLVEKRAAVEGITIVTQYGENLPLIKTSPSHLQQVFLNLFNNAFFALKDHHRPEIRIKTVLNDDYVAASLADNGCGIAPENLEKVFLPFFTTKPVGQGTGLGLSTCYGIIERLGGVITVSSEPDSGSVFTVMLPQSQTSESKRNSKMIETMKGGT